MELKLQEDLKHTDQLLQLTKDFSSRFLSAIDKLADKKVQINGRVSIRDTGLGGAGRSAIRAALVNRRTNSKDVLMAYDTMKVLAGEMVNKYTYA